MAPCTPGRADPAPYVTGVYWPLGDAYRCGFTVVNQSPESVYELLIAVRDASNAIAPPGWYANITYRYVDWNPENLGNSLPPQGTLGGFGFTIPVPPGTLPWGINAAASYVGGYVTPELIPEPSGLSALGACLAALAGAAMKRRR